MYFIVPLYTIHITTQSANGFLPFPSPSTLCLSCCSFWRSGLQRSLARKRRWSNSVFCFNALLHFICFASRVQLRQRKRRHSIFRHSKPSFVTLAFRCHHRYSEQAHHDGRHTHSIHARHANGAGDCHSGKASQLAEQAVTIALGTVPVPLFALPVQVKALLRL